MLIKIALIKNFNFEQIVHQYQVILNLKLKLSFRTYRVCEYHHDRMTSKLALNVIVKFKRLPKMTILLTLGKKSISYLGDRPKYF